MRRYFFYYKYVTFGQQVVDQNLNSRLNSILLGNLALILYQNYNYADSQG